MRKSLLAALVLAAGLAGSAYAQAPAPATPAKPAAPVAAPAAPAAKPATPAAAPAATTATTPAAKLLDINVATKGELEALKGIGAARSDAIIKGRPYKGKDELVQKSIVPQNVYDDIKDKIIARQH